MSLSLSIVIYPNINQMKIDIDNDGEIDWLNWNKTDGKEVGDKKEVDRKRDLMRAMWNKCET
jgi:hypothetical protein